MTKNRIRALLFDKDGTLLDFQRTWGPWAAGFLAEMAGGDAGLLARMAQELGVDLRRGKVIAGSVIVAGTPDEIAAVLARLTGRADVAALERRMVASTREVAVVPLVPLVPLLDGFARQGLRLGIATNDAEAVTRTQMQALGIDDRMDFIAGYDSGFGAKPGPGMCLAFADRIGLPRGSVAMIGDSLHDLEAAQAAGMLRIAVASGPAPAADLAPYADVVLPDISHLPGWLVD